MKKFLVVLVALLFATGAFAQDAAKKGAEFKYGVQAWAYGIMGSSGDVDWDAQHIRVRPMFTASIENVSAVVRLEVDQDYGKTSPDATDPDETRLDGADAGTDNKVVEVKWAYVQVKDFLVPNLTFTTGLKDYFFPMVVDNDFAITSASYDFGMGSATLAYLKLVEEDAVDLKGDIDDADADKQVYIADVTVKAGNIAIRPLFFYGTNDAAIATVVTDYALNVNGDFGMVSFDATGSYLAIEDDADTDISGYAYDVIVNVKPQEGITVGLFTTYVSGDDAAEDDDLAYYGKLDANGGAPDGRLFLLENNGIDSNGRQSYLDVTEENFGYTVYGLTAEAVMGKISVLAQFGYMTSAVDVAGDSAIGMEFDGQVAYEVAPGTSFMLQAAYLMAGDDTFYADDATQFAWGLTTKI